MKMLMTLTMLLGVSLAGCACGPTCEPGSLSCACKENDVCDDALVCGGDKKCATPTLATVTISAPTARGCELVLDERAGTTVAAVRFKGGAEGTWLRQAPRVAVTFVAGGDSPVSGQVELGLVGPASGVSVAKAGCVDVDGQRIAGVGASVN